MKRPLISYICAGLLISVAAWGRVIPDRYIVELNTAPVAVRMAARGRRVNPLAAAVRTEVQSEQHRTRLAIEQEGGEVLESMDTVTSAMVVHMPASQAARLAQMPGVRSVRPERRFKRVLDRAVVD